MEPLVVDDALDPARRARERQLTDSLSATFLARGDQRAAGVITSPDRDIRSLIREPGNERISGELSELAALRGSGPPFAVLLTGPVPGVPGR